MKDPTQDCRLVQVFCYILFSLAALSTGCGPASWDREFKEMVDATKANYRAAEVRIAALPLMADTAGIGDLPETITSLPIFRGRTPIEVLSVGEETNSVLIVIGGGFGHWGLLVSRSDDERDLSAFHRQRITKWGDGVYFFRE